jgi:hypothetical protein
MTIANPNLLCQSLDVRNEQPVVWRKELMPGYTVCLRPVSIHSDSDLQAIHRWFSEGVPARLPLDQLRVFFILMGESTYAQAFMVLLNDDLPIGQFEVYQVLHDELNNSLDAGEGDYRLYVPVMPVITSNPEITLNILKACIDYFFSCAGVKRVFWVVPVQDKDRNKLATKAGFQWLKTCYDLVTDGDQEANIYQCETRLQ